MLKPLKKRILFVTYGGGHVNMVIPVAKALLNSGCFDVRILGLTTAGKVLERSGLPWFGFADLVKPEDRAWLEVGAQLAGVLQTQLVPREETIAYLGLSYGDLSCRLGAEEAAHLYAEKGRQSFLPITGRGRLMAELAPDVVVTTNSPRAERAAVLAARSAAIPTLCMADLFAITELAYLSQPGYGDRVCVLSEGVRQTLIEAGRTPEEIVVTGNPAFDRLADSSVAERAAALRRVMGWEGKRVILWASQPEPATHPRTGAVGDCELPRKIDRVLADLTLRHTDWHVVIRLHPSESQTAIQTCDQVSLSDKTEDLAVLLAASDVVVTMTSTVGLEAVLLGKPLVALEVSVLTTSVPYAQMGLAYPVSVLTDLEAALTHVLAGKYSARSSLPRLGEATNKVAAEVRGLALQ